MQSKSSRSHDRALARMFLLAWLILIAGPLSGSAETSVTNKARLLPPENEAVPASLREKYSKLFLMGVALDGELPGGYSGAEHQLIRSQFNAVTPANVMKMVELQPAEGRFDFKRAEALVRYAVENGQKVCGHTLVWPKDERTPEWIFKDGDKPASRELLLRRMRTHVETVAKHFRGKVISWDVVNEPLGDGTNYLNSFRKHSKSLAPPTLMRC
jgi:endo-1,4-beta-xylanase